MTFFLDFFDCSEAFRRVPRARPTKRTPPLLSPGLQVLRCQLRAPWEKAHSFAVASVHRGASVLANSRDKPVRGYPACTWGSSYPGACSRDVGCAPQQGPRQGAVRSCHVRGRLFPSPSHSPTLPLLASGAPSGNLCYPTSLPEAMTEKCPTSRLILLGREQKLSAFFFSFPESLGRDEFSLIFKGGMKKSFWCRIQHSDPFI